MVETRSPLLLHKRYFILIHRTLVSMLLLLLLLPPRSANTHTKALCKHDQINCRTLLHFSQCPLRFAEMTRKLCSVYSFRSLSFDAENELSALKCSRRKNMFLLQESNPLGPNSVNYVTWNRTFCTIVHWGLPQ